VGELVPLMFELVALALTCNLTRIVTFAFGYCGHGWKYGWLGINEDGHGWIGHNDRPGAHPHFPETMVKIASWHAREIATLTRRLEEVPEANGTALDNSLVVWANENATGYHALDVTADPPVQGIPVVFIGRAGGRLPRPGRVIDAGPQDHHRVGATVMQLMGYDPARAVATSDWVASDVLPV
jgi:hypothetical protein